MVKLPETALCAFCGEPFEKKSYQQIYCKRDHHRACPICGADYIERNNDNLKKPPKVCSYECRTKLTKQRSLSKYGVDTPGNTPEARAKARVTCQSKWGVDSPLAAQSVRNKGQKTLLDKYGVTNIMKVNEVCKRAMDTQRRNHGGLLAFNTPESYERRKSTVISKYGAEIFVAPAFHNSIKRSKVSKINLQIQDKLNSTGIKTELEYKIDDKRSWYYDILLPDSKTLIEVNPTWTHSAIPHSYMEGIDRHYHVNKSAVAHKHGFRCIHIFDWDNIDKICAILTDKQKIYARSTEVWKIPIEVAASFLNKYHIQGSCRGQLLALGLVYKGELIQVMTFGRPRYDTKADVELLRFATHSTYQIVGGASKLLKFFVNTYEIYNIISYCDIAKFEGSVYNNLGMQLIRITPPQEVWSKGSKRITANLLRARGYDQLFGTDYGKGLDNRQLMIENGWLPVYDCGQKVYQYQI